MNKFQFDVDAIREAVVVLADKWKTLEVQRERKLSGRMARDRMANNVVGNFHIIGSGNFSIVMRNPEYPGVVIKFSPREDDAAFHYALWCRANPNKHAPHILRIEKIPQGYFIVMPEYKPWDEPDHVPGRRNMRDWAEYIAEYPERPIMWSDGHPESLGLFAQRLGKYFESVCSLDLHSENVMWDGDVLIITDPVSYNNRRDEREELSRRHRLENSCLDNKPRHDPRFGPSFPQGHEAVAFEAQVRIKLRKEAPPRGGFLFPRITRESGGPKWIKLKRPWATGPLLLEIPSTSQPRRGGILSMPKLSDTVSSGMACIN